ncbi:hypothetical protein PENVUL_c014G07580 [Penicillium vulpinum]|uniref:Uncharacterized protein n=1 Tax=Penicillium vulpinum TaxID=29845 RepID=A0A1V6RZR9_9EURO|nr:hypothetical protein PENVUL_c014G07580 [Penicillium vulpinum]
MILMSQVKLLPIRERYLMGAKVLLERAEKVRGRTEAGEFLRSRNGPCCMDGSNINTAFPQTSLYQTRKYLRLTPQATNFDSLFPLILSIVLSIHIDTWIVYIPHCLGPVFISTPGFSKDFFFCKLSSQTTGSLILSLIYKMLLRYLLALVIQLCWVTLGFAHEDATITIPWVTDAPDYFQGYGGRAIGMKDATTTYGINCLSGLTTCHRFSPDLTVIYGPNTYEMIASGYKFDYTSGCTLIGSPAPTGASCTETKFIHQSSVISSATVLVPATGADSTLGIFPAPLIVTDTGNFPAPSTSTENKASDNSHVSTSDASLTVPATMTVDSAHPASSTGGSATATGSLVVPTEGAFLNSKTMTTGVPTYFGNGTSPAHNNGTVTVTVLASTIPCHCECDCRQNETATATITVPMAMKSYGVKTAAPMALMCGIVAGIMFWM